MSVRMLLFTLGTLVLGAQAAPAAAAERYYDANDFAYVRKIDAHVHLHGPSTLFMAQALRDNFRVLTINVDYPDFPPPAEQLKDAVSLREHYPGRVAFAGTFSVDGFPSAAWLEAAEASIENAREHGAVGIKIWKNIGMSLQDAPGHYVMLDDPHLEPVLALIESRHLVLLNHQAEPLNCWLPPERMTVRSDLEYFREHPQYYMYQHPEMPAHDAILAARDRALARHPHLKVDAVHLASLEWDVDKVADFLERFPDARVDVAARMVHLKYQAVQDRGRVRAFLVRYQDRILYGSDEAYGPGDADPQAVTEVHRDWLEDWRFLTGGATLHSPDFAAPFKGLQLPRSVVDKIYRTNAEALFPRAWAPALSLPRPAPVAAAGAH
ncbi:MAG: amidohydrolase family protein [Proteobacteria bacterium]|nr:amidohydrolase family protein [Pseudomonadota bacterium]